MKKLLITEGYNDKLFFSYIFSMTNFCHESKIDIFNSEDQRGNLNPKETLSIRRFLERYSPYQVLIKIENGKPNVLSVFSQSIVNILCYSGDISAIIAFDHDHKSPEEDFNDIFTRTKSRKPDIDFELVERKNFLSSKLLVRKYALVKNRGAVNKEISRFNFLTFPSSLEEVAGIIDDADPEKSEKIRELAGSLCVTDAIDLFK